MSNTIDLEYYGTHGHLKPEDAQAFHGTIMRHHGVIDGDEVIAEWNRRDPDAPWGSGIAGKYVRHLTGMVEAFMKHQIAEASSYQPGEMVTYAGHSYEVAGMKKFPHGWMVGIYDEPPGKHVDYIQPQSLKRA